MSMPTITVKPLVWGPQCDGGRHPIHGYGTMMCHGYPGEPIHLHCSIVTIERFPQTPDVYRLSLGWDRWNHSTHPALEAAQSAAQVEWTAFVRAAITLFP